MVAVADANAVTCVVIVVIAVVAIRIVAIAAWIFIERYLKYTIEKLLMLIFYITNEM